MLTLDSQIEAVLFLKSEPMTRKVLAKILERNIDEINDALSVLEERLETRGTTLISKEDKVTLATSPEMSDLIESIRKEELSKDLGKAGLETLSIILYRAPITRAEIDYLRGVNSNFILRNLLIRGLIEKVVNPGDQRSYLYKPSLELLSFLGVSKVEDLPEYDSIQEEIKDFNSSSISVKEDEQNVDLKEDNYLVKKI
jgi:segregation and condensation protein B